MSDVVFVSDGNGAPSGFTYKGAWIATDPYDIHDVVTYGGQTYVCLVRNKQITPTNTTFWQLAGAALLQALGNAASASAQTVIDTSSINSNQQQTIDNSKILNQLIQRNMIVQRESASSHDEAFTQDIGELK